MPTQTFFNLPEEKQQRILAAAIKEFSQRGVEDGNLANIIRDAGISRGSLYQYIDSKEELYAYLFTKLRNERADHVQPAFALYKTKPFVEFFRQFYLLDSEFLLTHPSHIDLGKRLYTGTDPVSRGLIQRQQTLYKEWFLVAVEHDKSQGVIDKRIDASVLAELCVHFVTDIFIFQSAQTQISIFNLREHLDKMLYLIQHGIAPLP